MTPTQLVNPRDVEQFPRRTIGLGRVKYETGTWIDDIANNQSQIANRLVNARTTLM